MHAGILFDIGLCIVAATGLAYVARLARQPLLLAYLAAGVLIGPAGFRQITDPASIQAVAELGLAFLLFIVGLEIDVRKLVASGKPALLTTLVQVAGGALLGALAAGGLGYRGLDAAYLGAGIAFSSTMIVVKALSDRNELETVAGRMTLAILLVQDALAMAFLAIQPELGGSGSGTSPLWGMALSVAKGTALVAAALLTSRFVLPPLFRWVAKFPEIVLISAVSWCFLVCYAAMASGFSSAMGALLAGVSISTFPYSLDVVAKIRSLRDFFVTLFFVSLGMLLVVPSARALLSAVVLSAVVLVSRPLILMPLLRLFRYDNRTGLLCSLHLSQTSELGLVILLIGASDRFRHVGGDLVSLVVLILVITSTASTYLIQSSHRLAAALVRRAGGTPLEDPLSARGRGAGAAPAPIVLVGFFRVASSLVTELRGAGLPFRVIDFNPRAHRELVRLDVPCTYGDISHLDTLEEAGIGEATILVATVPDDFLRGTSNRKLLESLRRLNPEARIILTAESAGQALALYEAGADFVLVPSLLASARLREVIQSAESGGLEDIRAREVAALRDRNDVPL